MRTEEERNARYKEILDQVGDITASDFMHKAISYAYECGFEDGYIEGSDESGAREIADLCYDDGFDDACDTIWGKLHDVISAESPVWSVIRQVRAENEKGDTE